MSDLADKIRALDRVPNERDEDLVRREVVLGLVAESDWDWIPCDEVMPDGIVYVWDADWQTEYLALFNDDYGEWEPAVERESGNISHWAKRPAGPPPSAR